MTCGICGIINFGGLKKGDLDYFTKVLLRSQSRGKDASGIANQKLSYVKATEDAGKLVKTKTFKRIVKKSRGQKWIIGHTRNATRGDPQYNVNNHPLTVKKGNFLMVHNGVVGSIKIEDDPNTTDSYIIANAIKKMWIPNNLYESTKRAYNYFYGWASVAVISPKEIVLARRTAPLFIGEKGGAIVFASEGRFIRESKKGISLNDDSIIGYDTRGHIKKGKVKHRYRPPIQQSTYSSWTDEIGNESTNRSRLFRYRWKDYGQEYITFKRRGKKKNIRKKSWEKKSKKGKGWFKESRRHREARMRGIRKKREVWRKKKWRKR